MRVIEYGKIEETECICPKCGTRFAFCESDTEGSEQAGYFGVSCPLCSEFINL